MAITLTERLEKLYEMAIEQKDVITALDIAERIELLAEAKKET